MTYIQNKQQILKISKDLKLSHIGSCLSVLPILEEIYTIKKPADKLILDGAHSHLAHLMFTNKKNAKKLIQKDIHCNREVGCDASGGSLGHGIGIGIGYAMADRGNDVYVVITDGSFMEGSDMEGLRIAKSLNLTNLKVYANFNGFTAIQEVDSTYLKRIIDAIGFPVKAYATSNGIEELEGIHGHYVTI